MRIHNLLAISLGIFSPLIHPGGVPLCVLSDHCITVVEPLFDVLPETSAKSSFLRSGTTSHNDTCSEKEIYQSENVFRRNNKLELYFNPNHSPIYDPYCNQIYTQTSGAVYTQAPITKFSNGVLILHGAVTVKAKIDRIIPGIWPAIWMLPQDTAFTDLDGGASGVWPTSGEIDTLEMAGYSGYYNPPATYLTTLHFGPTPGDDIPRGYTTVYKNDAQQIVPLTDKEHEFTMEWDITLKNTVNGQVTFLNPANVASIRLSMYLDGRLYQSDKLIWNSYSPPVCDNGLVGTGRSDGTTCGVPVFQIPSSFDPLPLNDALPLEVFTRGFNSGFRLISNVASGGPIFSGDPIGEAGAREPVSLFISEIYLQIINNLAFVPNIFNGAKVSWLTPTIPGETIDHYTLEISGYKFNINKQFPSTQNQFTIPAHTLYGNRSYHAVVTAVGNLGTTVLVGDATVKIRP
ncbi:TPA: family 16 glycosylhydrolase [Legionella pneumophila subsp. pneumophila]|uniref:Family 16 glycosylhydrolase n=2 Tax=Legionella pneumophila TaxID=446 RepID=A0AAP3HBZ5_LEGPN|nr:family 16 glycosylhydrolase [Legionella pneumophila]ABQ55125.1 hypothetical protein LPC_1160 [Legionella pneumophila str. Corby]ADG25060.1 hypothetical protein lpa_02494 [Legionella pneumophila 2300/99 Alcoy]MCK1859750.1 family 16 glycosylhydrolase [Legionella pneumophila]MCO1454192.1 family 16 glycosylhydrolase [Legionella pneumophila]MCW8433767.1 family 16 glycosylhydrolase [Legionella pneumophila]